MADYLGTVDHLVPDLPYNWGAQAWSDEIVIFQLDEKIDLAIAQFPCVSGLFIVEWLSDAYSNQPTSFPISGPYKTLNAAYAAWKLMQ